MTPGPAVQAVVSAVRAVGSYDVVSLTVPSAPGWDRARPGQLVVLPADPARGSVLPAVHWLAEVASDPVHGTTVQLVVAMDTHQVGEEVRLLGPLGRGFPLPSRPVSALVVAHERSAAPVRWLVSLLRERGCAVHVLLSAGDPDRHLDPGGLRRQAASVVLTRPEDLPTELSARLDDPGTDPALVLAAGPRDLVRVVASLSAPRGRVVRVTALDPDTGPVCGTGVCGCCDVVVDDAAGARRVRPCLEGPVLPGEWLLSARSEARRAAR